MQTFHFLRFGTSVLIGILLAKSGLPTAQISIYETLLFLGNLVSFFWIMGGQNALLQYFPRLSEADKKKALFNVFLIFLALGIFSAALLFGSKNFIISQFTNYGDLPFVELICIYLVFNTPSFLIHIYYLLLKKFRAIVVFGILSFSLQIVVVVLPIFLGYSLHETFFGLIGLALAKFLWSLFLLTRHASFRFDFRFLKIYPLLALPLILHILIGNSVEYMDGLIVTSHFTDEKAFAIYRFGARELPFSLLLIGALVTALIPELSENFEEGLKQIKEKTKSLSHWLFPLSALLMLVSPFLFPMVYNADFQESAQVFNVYLLMLSSRILLPQVVIISRQKNYFLVISALIETAVNVSLSLILVQNYGLEGIAFASVLAYLLNKVNMIVFNRLVLKIPLNDYVPVRNYLIYNGLLFGSFYLSLLMN